MKFEEWIKENPWYSSTCSVNDWAKSAYNSAIDEAVKIVDARGQSDFPDSLIEQVVIKIKQLKEG